MLVSRTATREGGTARRDRTRVPAGAGMVSREFNASLSSRAVRWFGKLPLQGRQGTRRLIQLCHAAADPAAVARARIALRHAAAMNVVRHVLPLPVGVMAMIVYGNLAVRHPGVVPVLALGSAALLTLIAAAAAYAQAAIQLRLVRDLRRTPVLRAGGPGEAPGPGTTTQDSESTAGRGSRSYRWDRSVTLVLVAAALITVAPALYLEVVDLAAQRGR